MTIQELTKTLNELEETITESVDLLGVSAKEAQEKIYKLLKQAVTEFELTDGRFVGSQNLAKRFAALESKIYGIVGDVYLPSVKDYLGTYSTIDDVTRSLHKSYNRLEIEKELFTPSRRAIYDQSEYYLSKGLADSYVRPAKYLLLQQVSQGITIKDSLRILKNWNDGELTASKGNLASGEPVPTLQKYATQIARDTAFQYEGAIQNVIADKFQLDTFIYTGGIIKDSRPFCRHLVGLKRKIKLSEVPKLLEQFPQGTIPDTTKENFYQRRGGYSCRHSAFPVRGVT